MNLSFHSQSVSPSVRPLGLPILPQYGLLDLILLLLPSASATPLLARITFIKP